MQSNIIHHPPTPRYDERFANKRSTNAVVQAVCKGRDFSFLLSIEELATREEQMRLAYQAAVEMANGYAMRGD